MTDILRLNQVNDYASDIMSRFGEVLGRYYEDGKQYAYGIPGVKYCAGELNMSPGYFGDVVHRGFHCGEGKLGYEYPQHFTRVLRKQTGMLPSKYLEKKNR